MPYPITIELPPRILGFERFEHRGFNDNLSVSLVFGPGLAPAPRFFVWLLKGKPKNLGGGGGGGGAAGPMFPIQKPNSVSDRARLVAFECCEAVSLPVEGVEFQHLTERRSLTQLFWLTPPPLQFST